MASRAFSTGWLGSHSAQSGHKPGEMQTSHENGPSPGRICRQAALPDGHRGAPPVWTVATTATTPPPTRSRDLTEAATVTPSSGSSSTQTNVTAALMLAYTGGAASSIGLVLDDGQGFFAYRLIVSSQCRNPIIRNTAAGAKFSSKACAEVGVIARSLRKCLKIHRGAPPRPFYLFPILILSADVCQRDART